MRIEEIEYSERGIYELALFVFKLMGDSKKSFRYYESRPLTSIKSHQVTLLGYEGDLPLAYGHLDIEDGKVWLGICVSYQCRGKGYGREIMESLLLKQCTDIWLSVDDHNSRAWSMYEKYRFILEDMDSEKSLRFYRRRFDG